MAWIKKRTPDWWFFTVLPLFLFAFLAFLIRIDAKTSIMILMTQQLYFYAVILSSTEIGLRFKINQEIEESNRFKDSWPGVLILIFSAICMTISYFREDIFINYKALFFVASIAFTLGSIWLSNQNEFSGVSNFNFGAQRKEHNKEFSKRVENSKQPYKEVEID